MLLNSASRAIGRVVEAGGIEKERTSPAGCVAAAGGVSVERIIPLAVLLLPVVLLSSAGTVGCVVDSGVLLGAPQHRWLCCGSCGLSASAPLAVLLLPVMLLKSARKPVAVLELPVVLRSSALLPVAVLLMPVVFKERSKTGGRVVVAGGVEKSAALRWPCCVAGGVASSATLPVAVLVLPVVLLKSA